jgi:hypothetical protein
MVSPNREPTTLTMLPRLFRISAELNRKDPSAFVHFTNLKVNRLAKMTQNFVNALLELSVHGDAVTGNFDNAGL